MQYSKPEPPHRRRRQMLRKPKGENSRTKDRRAMTPSRRAGQDPPGADAPAAPRKNVPPRPPTLFQRGELITMLRDGKSLGDIARLKGSSVQQVTECLRQLPGGALVGLFSGLTRYTHADALLESHRIAPVTLRAPVDVMGVMLEVLERAKGIEAFLDHPPEGLDLPLAWTVKQHFEVMDTKLQWVKDFIDNRMRLLELVTVDQWIQELLAMIVEVEAEIAQTVLKAPPGTPPVVLGLQGRLMERIRAKILGVGVRAAPKLAMGLTVRPPTPTNGDAD